jgi:DHA1 family multidrug resistance protein-like MFS transporter/DHA1 family quinolone resistance protein-like MFS transporter
MEKALERDDRAQLLVLDLASFWLNISGSAMSFALVYHYRRIFGLPPANIGLSVSINTISYFIGCMILSPVVRALKPRYCVSISLCGMSLFLFLFSNSTALSIAYACIFIYGLFNSLLWPAVEMWISRGREGRALSAATGSFNFSWSFGAGLSSYIGGLLVSHSTYAAFRFTEIVYVTTMAFLLFMSTINPTIRAAQSEKVQNRRSNETDHSTPLRFFCWINATISNAIVSMVGIIFPLYALDVLGISEKETGALLLVRGFATCGMFVILGRTNGWRFNKKLILAVTFSLAAMSLFGATIHTKLLFILFFFGLGLIHACAYNMSMFHGISGALKRSRRAGIHETILALGSISGVVSGGYLYQRYSFSTTLFVIGIVSLIAFVGECVAMGVLSQRNVV